MYHPPHHCWIINSGLVGHSHIIIAIFADIRASIDAARLCWNVELSCTYTYDCKHCHESLIVEFPSNLQLKCKVCTLISIIIVHIMYRLSDHYKYCQLIRREASLISLIFLLLYYCTSNQL